MRFASLFAGIGGIELGLEQAGFQCTAQVEIDEGCRKVLAHHWPDAQRFSDIRKVKGQDLGQIDGLAGGFPCQDISLANPKGKGLAGERSGLWLEYLRLIDEVRPVWVLVENVHQAWRRWVPTVRRDLDQLGFRSEVFRLKASDFGAWHARARAFVIAAHPERQQRSAAYPNSLRELQPQGCIQDQWGRSCNGAQQGAASNSACERRGRLRLKREPKTEQGHRWPPEPSVARMVHGLSRRVDQSARRARERALGNSVVPACAEWCGYQIKELCYGN